MLNTVVLIGVKVSNSFTEENDDIHFSRILFEVQRPYWNSDGTITKDLFIVKVFRGTGDLLDEKYPVGTQLSVKGRLEESKEHLGIIIAEKIVYMNDEINNE